ncbi:hypothetical protein BJ508DRAFT_347602 [Ascobolus immersus RN42]|uniref:DNA2/NAM7 helicase-like C-terminal domain-containing protein n=1 Tax=Ascobolus immersus RN42 TaxID=1160509 RepID=A0A3N4IJV9_ASCIM|nr:hypothetical protein BJ508DRAFT_347602 [Ascobolus immersus RN42]
MHPHMSNLLRITGRYPYLEDHPSTEQRQRIRGLNNRLIWFTNQHSGQVVGCGEKGYGNLSYVNPNEAEEVIDIAKHLTYQGYAVGDIAIITPYKAQKELSAERLSVEEGLIAPVDQSISPRRGPLIETVRLATVDSFQGE